MQRLITVLMSEYGAERFPEIAYLSSEDIKIIGHYHDIGKSGISNSIWESPYRLSPEEVKLIHNHSVLGAYIINKKIDFPKNESECADIWEIAAQVSVYHHERWDGEGYPFGLKGKEIPLSARIAGVADSYEAMTSDRPYHKKIEKDEALLEIQSEAGKQFDPELAEIFCRVMGQQTE